MCRAYFDSRESAFNASIFFSLLAITSKLQTAPAEPIQLLGCLILRSEIEEALGLKYGLVQIVDRKTVFALLLVNVRAGAIGRDTALDRNRFVRSPSPNC